MNTPPLPADKPKIGGCRLCPRACGTHRAAAPGFCGVTDRLRIARAAPHFWEEPCISGDMGTGAVFFSGCNLRCRFCQNYEISAGVKGYEVTERALADIFARLEEEEGCHSISLVTGSHYIPQIIKAMDLYKGKLPFVFNCGGYESVEALRLLEGRIAVYLPDFKYSDSGLAGQMSAAPDYPERASAAILEMHRQTGNYIMGENGLLQKGVVIRHLLLPGSTVNTFGVLDWIAEHFSPGQVLTSLMCQYVPWGEVKDLPPFDRPVSVSEYRSAVSYLRALGIEEGYIQEPESASEAYIPAFDGE